MAKCGQLSFGQMWLVLAKFGLAKCGQIRMAKSGLAKFGRGPIRILTARITTLDTPPELRQLSKKEAR